MLELFTIGGGEYIVNVMNAVAAWTGGGGYKSLIRVVMVMGLIYTLLIVAFSLDWRAWFNWFLQSTAIYLCLMVPTASLKVTDRVNPSLAPSTVANVPLGLGVIASFTSQIGDYLTREAETVFVMPSQLQYSNNGIIYGSKLMEATRQIRITDPEFAANINEHMKRCVFYDILLGFKSMDGLAKSTDLWTDIGPGSPARAQPYITRSGSGVGSTTATSIVTCREAYNALTPKWTEFVNQFRPKWAKSLYPNLSNSIAEAKLVADLPVTNQAFTANASNALSIMRQNLAVNAFMQARDDMGGGTGSAAIDSFAATRADIQTRNTYSAIAQGAMKWVPILNIVLTVVFYAMFPVIFPLFLMPRTGVNALKGYATGFFYLAAWGPLYVVLHMILMGKGFSAGLAIANGGMSLGSFAGIGAVNDETATLAGYMIAAVPFLAAGMAKGAMAIASQATSFLAPSQNAAEAAALEATTGNYAYGNASLANQTVNTQSRDQWSSAPTFSSGAPTSSFRQSNGAVSTAQADGSVVTSQQGAISSFEWKPSFSKGEMSEIRQTASEFESQAAQHREQSSQSLSAANTTGSQIYETAQKSGGNEFSNGHAVNDALNESQNLSKSWSDRLVNDYGWTRDSADRLSRQAMSRGDVSGTAGISLSAGVASAGVNGALSANTSNVSDKSSSLSESERISHGLDFLNSEARGSTATNTRDSFFRAVSTSGDSTLEGLTQRRDASLTEAQTHSLEASRLEETGKRYSHDFSETGSQGLQSSRDLSQSWQTFVAREMGSSQAMRDTGYQTWMRDSDLDGGHSSGPQRDARDVLEDRFGKSYVDDMHAELGTPQRLGSGTLSRPDVSSDAGVRNWGNGEVAAVNSQGPSVNLRGDLREPAISSSVADRLDGSDGRMEAHGRQARADGLLAHGLGDGLSDSVQGTLNSSLGSTMPGIGPIVDRAIGRTPQTSFQAAPFVHREGVAVKDGVNLQGLSPALAPAITAIGSSARNIGLTAPTITSARDGHHNSGSLHPDGRALDVRANNLSVGQGKALADGIRNSLPSSYDVLFEFDRANPGNRHVHVEFDPKTPKRGG
jgi:conjugal transfer mating pair stabilization protein TraG